MAGKWNMAKAASKKLANAFGKAVQHPEATPEGRELVYKSKTVKNMPGDYRVTGQDTPAQRAFKAGRYQGDENYELSRDAIDERYSGEDRDVRKAVAGQEVDAMEDFNSDYRLKEEFENEFDKLTKRNVRENPQRNSFTEDEVRKESINMLKSGADISDVFEYLRGNTDYIKVNPTKLKEHTTIRTSPKSNEDADVGVVWDYLAERIDNPEKLDYIMDYHDEFIRQELRNGKSPEDIARTLDTDIFD